jgi:hypothetical protein
VREPVRLPVAQPLLLLLREALTVAEVLPLGLGEAEAEPEALLHTEAEPQRLSVGELLWLPEPQELWELLREPEALTVPDADRHRVEV